MAKALSTDIQAMNAQALMRAVESGDALAVKSILAAGAHINAALENGETALMRAAAKGYTDVVQLLLDEGADVNAKRGDGFTALIVAVFFNQEDVVRALLARDADTEAQTRLGTTAEKWAASRGFTGIVELLHAAEAARKLETVRHTGSSADSAETKGSLPVVSVSGEASGIEQAKVGLIQSVARGPERLSVQAVAPGVVDEVAAVSSDTLAEREVAKELSVAPPRKISPKVKAQTPPTSLALRFRKSLASWPVTMVAFPLVLASGIVVYAIWRRPPKPVNVSQPATQGTSQPLEQTGAAQPGLPQPLPPAANIEAQPTPAGMPQDLQSAQPGVIPGSQSGNVVPASDVPVRTFNSSPPADNLPSVPTVLSESGVQTSEGEQSSRRGGRLGQREKPLLSPDAEQGDQRQSAGAQQSVSPRTPKQDAVSVPFPRLNTGASPPASAPTPQPTPKRKVIQWP
ncbi:MAG: ankyrin repeat domain-containing protein [Acidobacteria bacterium]|nr:ankyrin repeat domain-containing protein [Acidobacteriota bacterium]